MSLPKLAVNRRVTVIMGVAMTLLLGYVSLTRLPIDLLPNIEAPILAVSTNYSNAGPYEVENLVSRPLEEALGGVNNIKSVRSVSSRGNSVVIAEFDWGIDMNFVALDVRERIDMVKDFLPDEADSPIIAKFDPSASPIMQLVLRGDTSAFALRQRADELKSQFERLEGVASVNVSGGQEREIKVILHPGLLQAAGVSMDTISQALRFGNLNLPAGNVTANNLEYVLRTTGEFTSVDQIRQVRIPTISGGLVKLSDIAIVEDSYKETTQLSRFNGQSSVMLAILKEASGNSVLTADLVKASVDQLNQQLAFEGLEVIVAQDTTEFIKVSVNSVTQNAIIGGALAIIMLLLFLRNFWTTLVIGAAIPISVVATFVLMYFSTTTLNMVSLGGLALGVGMLVDNGIVVLENIFRHRELGKDSVAAAELGAEQMAPAIMASTLTTISVFLPVIFVSGIAAEIFRDMALTVTFSLLASLLISLTLVPMLAALVLKQDSQSLGIKKLDFMEVALVRVQEWYGHAVGKVLRYRWLTVGVAVVTLLISYALVQQIGMEFMPEMDQGEITIRVNMPKGTLLVDTNEVIVGFEQYASSLQEVENVSTTVGQRSSNTGGSGGSETGRVRVKLVPLNQRARSTDQLITDFRHYAQGIPGADVTVRMDGLFSGSFGDPIQVQLGGDDLALLHSVSHELGELIARVPGTQEVTNSMAEGQPEIRINMDREKIALHGVTVGQLASTIRMAVSGTTVTRYRTGGQEVDVVLRLAQDWRQNPGDIENIPVQTARGGVVPLKELAWLEEGEGPVSINRSERNRQINVTGQIVGRDLGSTMNEVRSVVDSYTLPPGVSVSFGGEDAEMGDAFGQLALAMLLGIALVYMVLASQFESLLQPLVIMVTLPMAIVGVVIGLLSGGVTFSVVAFVGAIMLAGIVVNNGIVFIDYVNQLRSEGYCVEEALVQAGKTRLRPILMTTLTTVLGMIPLAIGLGEGNELQRPIALVVIGGLTTSTVLTLFMIPVFYLLIDGFSNWLTTLTTRDKDSVHDVVANK